MSDQPIIAYDDSGRLAADLLCTSCGHNLRGLLPGGKCGECGSPVKWSLAGTALNAADPEWLGRLRSGVFLITLLTIWIWTPPAWPLYGYGLWRLTTPEPRGRGAREGGSVQALRMALTWGLSLTMALLLLAYGQSPKNLPPQVATWLPDDALLCLLACGYGLIQFVASLRLWEIGRRGSSLALQVLSMFAAVTSLLAALSFGLAGLLALVQSTKLSFEPFAALGGLFLIPAVVPFLAALLLAWRVLQVAGIRARALRSEIRVWQGPPPGASWKQRAAASAPAAAGSGEPAES